MARQPRQSIFKESKNTPSGELAAGIEALLKTLLYKAFAKGAPDDAAEISAEMLALVNQLRLLQGVQNSWLSSEKDSVDRQSVLVEYLNLKSQLAAKDFYKHFFGAYNLLKALEELKSTNTFTKVVMPSEIDRVGRALTAFIATEVEFFREVQDKAAEIRQLKDVIPLQKNFIVLAYKEICEKLRSMLQDMEMQSCQQIFNDNFGFMFEQEAEATIETNFAKQ
ncbi:MAG: hypothetical protein KDH94_01545 [Coxiellaceae bacterium]|nr:hypothetical protein [Coxiellaceae bacterium]